MKKTISHGRLILPLCLLLLFLHPQDDSFLDSSFLDPDFVSDEQEVDPSSDSSVTLDVLDSLDSSEPSIPSSVSFNFNLINLPRYNVINQDIPYDPTGELYFSSFDNLLQVHTKLRYTFWQRKLSFNWDSSLYTLLEKREGSEISFTSRMGYYLNELNLTMNLGHLTLGLGKITINEGTAFLINPTDFLDIPPKFADFNTYYRNPSLGSYQVQLGLLLGSWEWYLSYIPFWNTIYLEFDRSYADKNPYLGEVWSRVSWQGENLKTKLIFYWNGYPQGGVNLTATLGDEVVIFFDGAARVISRPKFADNGNYIIGPNLSYYRYKVEEDYSYMVPMLIGFTYTPANLFTLSAEFYYNGSDDLNYWKGYKGDLDNLNRIATELGSTSSTADLEAEYRGEMKKSLLYHDPLSMQPFFISIGLSRNDAFSDISTQIIHFSSHLSYSILDTGFLWNNHIVWEAPETLSLGLFTSWFLGREDGVFTSVPNKFSVGLSTVMWF